MSNLIKSGFVAFSQDDKLVIDANQNKIIKSIDAVTEDNIFSKHSSVEEALAEALILDAELEGTNFDDDNVLTMETSDFSDTQEDLQRVADDMIQFAKMEADSIVDKAHDEAEQLRASAYDEADKIKSQAKEEGYRAGYEEAMETARGEIAQKEALLEKELQEGQMRLQEMTTQLIVETENRMVEILCQLIPSITGVVIDNQKDVLLYMINNAMQDLDNSKHFVIKVSSNDYEELVERKEEIYGALNPSIDMEIFEDAKLSSMQCLIETDNGFVDVSLDVQLENLINALKLMTKE